MHAALWHLLWMDFRGSLRSVFNFRRNWKQLLLFALMLSFVAMFVIIRNQSSAEMAGRFGPAMPFWALLYLSMTWLSASADRGLIMRPAEAHFIAGGPFPERDVITLSLIRLAFRAFVSALVLSLLAMAYSPSYPSALIGIWMLISVSLLVGMVASLSARSAHQGAIKRLRRAFTLAAIATLVGLIVQSLQLVNQTGQEPRVSTIAAAAIETPIGAWVLPPLAWMFAPISADSFAPTTLVMLPSRFAVLAALVGCIYALGGRYLESSTARTDLSQAKRRTAQRSGLVGSPQGSSWTKHLSVPEFGRWGGVGSVAWMQVVHSLRILPRFLVFTVTIVAVVLVIPLMVDPVRISGWGTAAWMGSLTGYADFLLLLQLPVGFLGPVAQRESLKMLPIPPWRLVLGLLAGPIIPLFVLHLLVTLLFLYLVPEQWKLVLQTAVAMIPVALVLVSNINLLGSWNIIRPRALQQRDALAAGRAMASVWIFFLMLTPALVSAVTFAILGGALVPSTAGYTFGAAFGAWLSSFLYIALLARSFARWQPGAAEGGKEEAELDR